MKKVCKPVFCAVVILLLGVFSQQETKAGETNERHYSRTYSVLSANVGNFKHRGAARSKLQPDSDEAIKVATGIKLLKPDIMVLIEASAKDQVESMCVETGKSYSVYGGQYDFICVKNEIIAKKDDGKQDIRHVSMPEDGPYEKYKGNSVGYVDVGLKDEGGRKVRLFYAHFPSPGAVWSKEEHKAHRDAFDWISGNLNIPIPCLIAGDLNNDFTQGEVAIRKECSLVTSPVLYSQCLEEQRKFHSSIYIEERVKNLKLWIFNPLAQPLQLQFLDGSTKRDYEATWRPPEGVWEMTIDWVMGKDAVPPFLDPGGQRTDLITGTTGTIRTNFVTSPPNWWKDTGIGEISRLNFDHKPLYGKVVFFWEERIQPDILGKWVADDIHLAEISSLQFERDGTVAVNGPFANIREVKPFEWSNGQWDISQGNRIAFSFTEQKGLKADGQIDGDRIREFKINDLGGGSPFIKSPNAEVVKTTPKGKVWSEYVDEHPQYGLTSRMKIRPDKTFLVTVSRICRWKIAEGGLITLYDKDEKGNDIELWTHEVRDNKLIDKTCGSVYVRAKKGGKRK